MSDLAKPLEWREPTDRDINDEDPVADGIGGKYRITAPEIVPDHLLARAAREKLVEIDGRLHFKAMLWWPMDEFSFLECDSLEAAKAAAEADWQKRFAALLAELTP